MSDDKAAQKNFYRALKEGRFAPVYYIHGDEHFLKEGAVRDLIKHATDPGTRDFNLEVRRGAETDAGLLGSLLATPPMMASHRVIVIRDVGALKKDARAMLDRYLAGPASDVVLVLVSAAGGKGDKLIESSAVAVPFGTLSGDRLAKWIAHYSREVLATEITPQAASLLQASVGDDLLDLSGELHKLAAYANHRGTAGGSPAIDEDAVSAIVGVRRGETMGDLLDRIANRDAVGALAMIGHVLSQPKASGVTIVMALATQTLAVGWGLAAMASGMPRSQLSQGFYGLLKAKSAFTGRLWGEAVSAWVRAASNGRWTDASIDEALDALLAADVALKQTGVSSEEQIVTSLVLTICTPSTSRRAA